MHHVIEFLGYFNQYPFYVISIIAGACIGSFVNAESYRYVVNLKHSSTVLALEILDHFNVDYSLQDKSDNGLGRKEFSKFSQCDHCGERLPFYLNVPIFGWLFLHGRSHCCNQKIPGFYALSELVFSLFFGTVMYLHPNLEGAFICIVFSLLYAGSYVDSKTMYVPDLLITAVFFLGLIYKVYLMGSINNILYPVGVYLALMMIIKGYEFIRKKEMMGAGDIVLYSALSVWVGSDIAQVIFISCVLGIAGHLLLKSERMAFVPYISAAFMATVLLNE